MNKLILGIFLVLFSYSKLHSQDANFFVSGGYNLSSVNMDGLNFVTKRYNDTRSFLTKKMDEINQLTGFMFSAGIEMSNSFVFEATYVQKKAETSSEGVVNDTAFRRDLRTSLNTFNLGIGGIVFSTPSVKSIVGFSFDFGSVGNQTRVYPKGSTVPSYDNVEDFVTSPVSNMMIGITPYTQLSVSPGLSNLELVVKPYYQLFFTEADYSDVNAVINPNTYTNDNKDDQKNSPNNFGIELKLQFSFDVR